MSASDEVEIEIKWGTLTIGAAVYLGETPHGQDPPEVLNAWVCCDKKGNLMLLLDGEDELCAALIEAARDFASDEEDGTDDKDE
jgi:hypothetical protein